MSSSESATTMVCLMLLTYFLMALVVHVVGGVVSHVISPYIQGIVDDIKSSFDHLQRMVSS